MKKTLIYTIFVLFYCYHIPAPCFSNTQEDTFRTGIEWFNQKNYEPAYKVFLELFEDDPENIEFNFYLGRSAFEIGNYEMAVMAFERILITSPFEQRVKLELARAFQKLGANNTARKYCNEVLAANPPKAVKLNIKNFLSFIDKSEQIHFFSGQLLVGIDWNNNVWASPSSHTIKTVIGDIDLTGTSATKTQDYIYNTALDVTHTYRPLYSQLSWKTQAIIYQGTYNQTGDLDTLYLSGQTGPEFIFNKNKIGLSVLVSQIQLDNNRYESTIGIQAAHHYRVHSDLQLTTVVSIKEHDYPDSPLRDSIDKNISFEVDFSYLDTWFALGVKAQKESVDDDEFSYKKYTIFTTVAKELFFNTLGFISYEYQHSEYDKTATLFTKPRLDQLHFAGCGLRKKIWQSSKNNVQNIFINLNYQHIWAFSNILLYEYTKDLVQLSLTYNF